MSETTLIQIVDKNDNPIRGGSIDEAQLNGLWHRVARVMIENPDGKVLLQLRAGGSNTYPNCWDNSAAGHVDEGENYLEAAMREMNEEIGVKGGDLQEAGYYKTQFERDGRTFNRFNKIYTLQIPSDTQFTLQPSEVSAVKWFSIEEVKKLLGDSPEIFTDGAQDAINRLYS